MSKYSVTDIRRTIRYRRNEFLSKRNVINIGIGWKHVKGLPKPYACIIVSVRTKGGKLTKRDRIPTRIRALGKNKQQLPYYIPTDVIEVPEIYNSLAPRGGQRLRRVLTGRSAFIYTTQGSSNVVTLTNSHVVAKLNTTAFGKIVAYRNDDGPQPLGTVDRMLRIRTSNRNKIDAALIHVLNPAIAHQLSIGNLIEPINGYGRILFNPNINFYYWLNGRLFRCNTIDHLETNVLIRYPGNRVAIFEKAWRMKVNRPPRRGHSGSLIFRRRNNTLRACGILFAGDTDLKQILVHPIKPTLTILGRRTASENGISENVSVRW